MTLKLSTGLRNGMAGTAGFAGSLNSGCIEIRSGTQPATADAAVTGNLLGLATLDGEDFTPGSPDNGLVWDTPSGGRVGKPSGAVWKFVGLTPGTATWFRFRGNAADAGGISTTLPRMDGSLAVSGADASITNIAIEVGAINTIDIARFTVPTL